ncbi:AAA family ATPase [Microbacterium sp. 20-116]|uniref:AAA family ATPase n=1 Tax=Microbacterium sp. 20-116 TaxID=3239883 RepID=UPI0034E26901
MTSTERTVLVHEGRTWEPFVVGNTSWHRLRLDNPDEARRVIAQGSLVTPEGEELAPLIAKRVKARLLRAYADRPRPGVATEEEGRWLVDDVWRWGHKPLLAGQPRAGKSTLVADLIGSLLVPGRQFLDHYAPVDLTDAERERGVWLINAENPEPELRTVLESAGLEWWPDDLADGAGRYFAEGESPGWLLVDHLERLGGPRSFDLRIPEVYDMWVSRIMDLSCATCDGRDEAPPLVVIVDGLTAILGSDTTGYGAWNARFRDLMQEIEVPNALVVAHSPMGGGEAMNGVESVAGADGSWKYQMSNVHDPKAHRTFSGSRRLIQGGIEGGRVTFEGGRLRLNASRKPVGVDTSDGVSPRSAAAKPSEWETSVLARLRKAGSAGLMKTEVTGRGKEGTHRREALDALERRGVVNMRPDGKGHRYFLAVIPG